MRLILLGLSADKARLEDLAARISACGYATRFECFTEPLGAQAPEQLPGAENAFVLHCWTHESIGPAGKAFQANALLSKELGSYRGLICDDVEVPDAVLNAIDFRLTSSVPADLGNAVSILVQQLEVRLGGHLGEVLLGAGWMRHQLNVLVRLVKTNVRVSWALLGTLLLTVVGGVSDGLSLWDKWDERATEEQQRTWMQIEGQDSCEAFEAYLAKFGIDAPFAKEARYRLDRQVPVQIGTNAEALQLPFGVPYQQDPIADLSRAKAEVVERAASLADLACRPALATLGKSGAGARVLSIEAPDCTSIQGGYLCRASGVAECMTAKPVLGRQCKKVEPPSGS